MPELKPYLTDTADTGSRLAERLHPTPAAYADAAGGSNFDDRPAGWIGGMPLKTLREENPTTRDGRPYTPEERDHLWNAASTLAADLPADIADDLRASRPSRKLSDAVERLVGRAACTLTGRFPLELPVHREPRHAVSGPGRRRAGPRPVGPLAGRLHARAGRARRDRPVQLRRPLEVVAAPARRRPAGPRRRVGRHRLGREGRGGAGAGIGGFVPGADGRNHGPRPRRRPPVLHPAAAPRQPRSPRPRPAAAPGGCA